MQGSSRWPTREGSALVAIGTPQDEVQRGLHGQLVAAQLLHGRCSQLRCKIRPPPAVGLNQLFQALQLHMKGRVSPQQNIRSAFQFSRPRRCCMATPFSCLANLGGNPLMSSISCFSPSAEQEQTTLH